VIKANSTIGSEGFRFIPDQEKLEHVPQIGGIRIGNHVWIGSNVAIERGSLRETVIDDEVKVDDLVQIGYDSRIGRATQITAGTIVGGGAVIEERCWIAPNSSIDAGVVIGRNSIVGMGSVIRRDVAPDSVVAGVPGRLLRKRTESPKRR
jgi:UDP-3-O-[3-hydroxymyristoyl] glucosamine N-acyltransferase